MKADIIKTVVTIMVEMTLQEARAIIKELGPTSRCVSLYNTLSRTVGREDD